MKTPLSERIRPNSEAAPWVIDEVKKLEELNKEMLEGLKVAESEIRCQQLEADFNYARCHGLPTPKIDEIEKEEKWCDEVYMLRELIKRVEGENQ
jgi:hypothetical protein